MTEWGHDALAADLMDARHQAGEIAMERVSLVGQLDVVSVRLSWSRPLPTGYEIKVSRTDFLSDIRSEKWRKYLPSVERLYFCVPAGLVAKGEVPAECGLMYRGPERWYSRRRAPVTSMRPERYGTLMTALLFRHYPAWWRTDAVANRDCIVRGAQMGCEVKRLNTSTICGCGNWTFWVYSRNGDEMCEKCLTAPADSSEAVNV